MTYLDIGIGTLGLKKHPMRFCLPSQQDPTVFISAYLENLNESNQLIIDLHGIYNVFGHFAL